MKFKLIYSATPALQSHIPLLFFFFLLLLFDVAMWTTGKTEKEQVPRNVPNPQ